MHCASACQLRCSFWTDVYLRLQANSTILIATYVCMYGGSGYEFWHVGAGSAGCSLAETQHLLRGAHSLREGEKVFCTAGHSADKCKSSQMIYLKCSKGRGKLKDKLRHGTEHLNAYCRSYTPTLLALHFCKHQEIGLHFKGAASKHPQPQRCAQTSINETPEEIRTVHPR